MIMKTRNLFFVLILNCLLILSGIKLLLARGKVPEALPSKDEISYAGKTLPVLTVWDVVSNVARYQDNLIAVKGRYHGWHGKLSFPPPVTRSDWILADETGQTEIYVTGKQPENLKFDDLIVVISYLRKNQHDYYLEAVKIIKKEITR